MGSDNEVSLRLWLILPPLIWGALNGYLSQDFGEFIISSIQAFFIWGVIGSILYMIITFIISESTVEEVDFYDLNLATKYFNLDHKTIKKLSKKEKKKLFDEYCELNKFRKKIADIRFMRNSIKEHKGEVFLSYNELIESINNDFDFYFKNLTREKGKLFIAKYEGEHSEYDLLKKDYKIIEKLIKDEYKKSAAKYTKEREEEIERQIKVERERQLKAKEIKVERERQLKAKQIKVKREIKEINQNQRLREINKVINNNESRFLFVDIEATGLPKNMNTSIKESDNWPRIVQIAWKIYDGFGKLINERNYIVYPEYGEIPLESSLIHSITTGYAKTHGTYLEKVLDEFYKHAEESNLIIAHNSKFDMSIIASEYYRLYSHNPTSIDYTFCTMLTTTNICKIPNNYGGYKWPKLQELHYKLFNTNFKNEHDAEADVRITAKCFFELRKRQLI